MKKIKRTQILTIIEPHTSQYQAMIIIPITPLSFNDQSTKDLKNILKFLLIEPKKYLNKKEEGIYQQISSNHSEINVLRNFNLLVNKQLINISEMDTLNNTQNFDSYLKLYQEKTNKLKFTVKYTHIIFKYSINLHIQNH